MTMILAFVFGVIALHPKVKNRNAFKQLKIIMFNALVQYELPGDSRTSSEREFF